MIVMRLCGGLGNQLFQYAVGRRLALANDSVLVLDLDWYHRSPGTSTPRRFELFRYPIVARVAGPVERYAFRVRASLASRGIHRSPRWKYRREHGQDFDPVVGALTGNVYLDGYWQCPGYFDDVAALLRRELSPKAALAERDEEVRRQIDSTNAISVHVRRGDYAANVHAASHHGTCSIDYYESAIERLASVVDRPHFFVFSDEIDWAKAELSFPAPVTFVDHNGPASAFQDLRLMSFCQHHIIANSSFSWWGAWLSANPSKRVVAPRRWYADGRATPALIPADWVSL